MIKSLLVTGIFVFCAGTALADPIKVEAKIEGEAARKLFQLLESLKLDSAKMEISRNNGKKVSTLVFEKDLMCGTQVGKENQSLCWYRGQTVALPLTEDEGAWLHDLLRHLQFGYFGEMVPSLQYRFSKAVCRQDDLAARCDLSKTRQNDQLVQPSPFLSKESAAFDNKQLRYAREQNAAKERKRIRDEQGEARGYYRFGRWDERRQVYQYWDGQAWTDVVPEPRYGEPGAYLMNYTDLKLLEQWNQRQAQLRWESRFGSDAERAERQSAINYLNQYR